MKLQQGKKKVFGKESGRDGPSLCFESTRSELIREERRVLVAHSTTTSFSNLLLPFYKNIYFGQLKKQKLNYNHI